VVIGVEGNLVLRPLEPWRVSAWLNGGDLTGELLERRLSPAEDTSDVPVRLLVAPEIFLGVVVVGLRRRLWLLSVRLRRRLLVTLVPIVFATATNATTATTSSATIAATIPAPPGAIKLLMELLELLVIFSVVGVLLVEQAVRTVGLAPLGAILAVVLALWFRREDGWFLTLVFLGLVLGWRSSGSRFRCIVNEQTSLLSLGASVGKLKEPDRRGQLIVDGELLSHPDVGDTRGESGDDFLVRDPGDPVADLA
jgi:hypothetical protein